MALLKRDLLTAIDRIYDAGTGSGSWQQAVEAIQSLIPAAAINLQGYQKGPTPQFLFVHHGYDHRFVEHFQREYAATNPWAAYVPRMPLGVPHVISESEYLPVVQRTDFYSFASRHGYGYGVGMPIWANPERFFFMVVECSERKAEKLSKPGAEIARLLSTHLARSFAISHRLESAERRHDALASFLARAEAPIIVVDAARRVRFANRAGEQLLAAPSLLERPAGGRLTLTEPAADAALGEAVKACTACAITPRSPLLVDAAARGASFRIAAVPLTADGTLSRGPAVQERLALLLFIRADRPADDAHALFRRSLGLTPAETDLAVALSEGERLSEYAFRRGVSVATVRNQLQAIYGKTLTHRQGELVALLSGLRRGRPADA